MNMTRRGFLGAILAAGIAPAVVKAASLMKVVPLGDYGIVGFLEDVRITKGSDIVTVSGGSPWHHVAVTVDQGQVKYYLDGTCCTKDQYLAKGGAVLPDPSEVSNKPWSTEKWVNLSDVERPLFSGVQLTDEVARDPFHFLRATDSREGFTGKITGFTGKMGSNTIP